jgi:hypothetical protein
VTIGRLDPLISADADSHVALLLALGEAPALAATLTVAPGVAPDIVPDGFCSLIEAIENANADPSRPTSSVASLR